MDRERNFGDSGAAAGGLGAFVLAIFGGVARHGGDDIMRATIHCSDDVARIAVQPADDFAIRLGSLSDDAARLSRPGDFHVQGHLSRMRYQGSRDAGDIAGHAEIWHPVVDGTRFGIQYAIEESQRQ